MELKLERILKDWEIAKLRVAVTSTVIKQSTVFVFLSKQYENPCYPLENGPKIMLTS